jgi:hypothetical protein
MAKLSLARGSQNEMARLQVKIGRMLLKLAMALLVVAISAPAFAQEVQKSADDPAQLKATIIKLQKALLAKERENGLLRATVAELQDAALEAAIDTMDPEVKKALGRPEPKATPAETPPPKR